MAIGPGQNPGGLSHQPFPRFLEAGGISYYPPGFDLRLQAAGRAGALGSDLRVSHCAVPLNLHVVRGRWSGDQQEFRAAQAPVDLGVHPAHLLGKMCQVIHLLTRAEKRVSLGTLISPTAGRHGASCCPERPLTRGSLPLLVSLGLVSTSGLRDTGLGSRWTGRQFILMPLGWRLPPGRYTGLT